MNGTFKTKDASNKIGIPGNMIRKYSQILEQYGFEFHTVSNTRLYTNEDLHLIKSLHEKVEGLNEDIHSAVVSLLQDKHQDTLISVPVKPITSVEDVSITIQRQNKKFDEFMGKLDTLAQLNEAIIHQNSTLISQNRQKDDKLDELMQQVYVKESKQEEMIHDLVHHVHKNEDKQEEKLNNLLNHLYKKEAKQEEKMGKLFNHMQKKETTRDEQLMQLIREMQETKRMIAASKEQTVFKSIRNIFTRFKSDKAPSRP
ncbi:DUF3967 domain-containing protein [Ectobacillus sp. JY-23]|uniref:DUF3967 domain-containing protein n=1 Tax=Ectobacillus sp. JY-23 TaxID=2933872 RepID=UPI001FF4D0C5|nr:DUF3967 domain-containing protein [Ectobacillus sp. JY-23]UOY93814.1 DUF3967 domain-containing protein [Ectobacillus sp. JY-23]